MKRRRLNQALLKNTAVSNATGFLSYVTAQRLHFLAFADSHTILSTEKHSQLYKILQAYISNEYISVMFGFRCYSKYASKMAYVGSVGVRLYVHIRQKVCILKKSDWCKCTVFKGEYCITPAINTEEQRKMKDKFASACCGSSKKVQPGTADSVDRIRLKFESSNGPLKIINKGTSVEPYNH